MKYRFDVLMALAVLAGHATTGARAAAPPKALNVAFYTGQGQSFNAQLSTVLRMALDVAGKEMNVPFHYKMHPSLDSFQQELKKGGIDVGFSLSYHTWLGLAGKPGYTPLLAFGFYGLDRDNLCFFTGNPKTNPSLKAMKGKTFATYDGEEIYYLLRDRLGTNPSAYFQNMKISPNGFSSMFSVAMGEVEGAFISELSALHMKFTNPAIYKKVHKLECAPPIPMAPLFVSDRVPPNVRQRVMAFFKNARQEPAAKPFLPLMRQTNTQFIPVTAKDYQWLLNLMKKGQGQGWGREFRDWSAKAGRTQKR